MSPYEEYEKDMRRGFSKLLIGLLLLGFLAIAALIYSN